MTALRPNHRRARALALEIEVATNQLDQIQTDPSVTSDEVEELRAELNHLKHEFFLTGVSSEYEL